MTLRLNARKALILSLMVVISASGALTAAAFSSGQNASVVIGHNSFTTGPDNSCYTNSTAECTPVGIAFDPWHDLWAADTGNNRILEYPSPQYIGEPASVVLGFNSLTASGPSGNCESTSASTLCAPTGIVFNHYGDLFVADTLNNRVLEFANSPPFTSSHIATGQSAVVVLGQPNFADNQRNEGGAQATGGANSSSLDNPTGLALDSSGNLWVADSANNRVVEYSEFFDGQAAVGVLGQPTLNFPITTAVTGTGSSPDSLIAGACYQNANVVMDTGLCNPIGLAFDNSGNLWVADNGNNRVVEYSYSSTLGFTSGETSSVFLGQNGDNADVCGDANYELCGPTFIAFDSAGNLWVSDGANVNDAPTYGNNRLVMFPSSHLTTAGSETIWLGQAGPGSDSCNVVTNTASTQSGMCFPYGVAVDSGNVWVADHGNDRVLEFNASGIPTPEFPIGTFISVAAPLAAVGLYVYFTARRGRYRSPLVAPTSEL